MALDATHWTIDRATGDIRYTGNDHNGAAPSYATVIEFHRWIQDLADDAEYTGDDELDIIDKTPSDRSTDNIITLKNGFNIDANASEHLYDGSIIQGTIGVDQIIYDGIVNYGNAQVQVQVLQDGAIVADDWWNYNSGGTHTGAADASVLTDSGATWTVDELVGKVIKNTTDGSWGLVTENTSNTVTAVLAGGTEDDWDNGDAYLIGTGLNADAAAGISHRFMILTHDFVGDGGDIDGRRLIGTSRTFGKTYSEFKINGTSRGNNVFALVDSIDLNNTTAYATVESWSTIVNATEGFVQLDVDINGSTEDYYSEWDKDTYSINQYYERMKWISRDGSITTNYALNGEVFRGITHEIDVDGGTGTWGSAAANLQAEELTWSGGTGYLMAVDNETGSAATKLWIQLLTGVLPVNNDTITGTTSSATADAELTGGTITERTISTPFVGASTGSALIGSYGLTLETTDLLSTDKVFDLTNTQVTPPNNVTFTVFGLKSGEDRVLVTNDATGIDFTQMALATALVGTTTSVDVGLGNIPQDTPNTSGGTIRIERDDGLYSRHPYSAYDSGRQTFTITSHNFTANPAQIANEVFVTYIDKLAGAVSEAFTTVYNADRTLFVRVRDGGTAGDGEGIKTAETTGALGSTGGSATVNRISDV